ncbi:MAG: PcfJ domain-containing protein [Lachnospiraceae bacterium]|nr:PcfJ domain-containing protein [Lachnospiraceae bacterium]
MDKRELIKLPCTAPDWMIEKAQEYTKDTFLLRRKFGRISTYEIYQKRELLAGDTAPTFIIFRTKNDWINYTPKKECWTKAKFENAVIEVSENGRVHWSVYYAVDQYKILKNLKRWQNKIGEKRLKERRRKEREKIDEIMRKVPELPEDFDNFIENDLMKQANYIIYNRKDNKAYCTRCESDYTLDELEVKNNTKTTHMGDYQHCPYCRNWMKQISYGMSRVGKGFIYGTEIMQPYEKGVIVREFVVHRDFEKDNTGQKSSRMKTEYYEIHRYIVTPEAARQYEYEYTDGNGKRVWADRTNANFKIIGRDTGKFYTQDVKEIIEKSGLHYEGLGELLQNQIDKNTYATGMERPLCRLLEKPYIEQLVKSGLNQLASTELEKDYHRYALNAKETKLTKLLGINKEELRILREQKNQEITLEIMQEYHSNNKVATQEMIEAVVTAWSKREIHIEDIEKLIKKEVREQKVLAYVKEQGIRITDFIDHLDLMEKLEIPKKKTNIYPKDFVKFHQDEIEEELLRDGSKISNETNTEFQKTYARWKKIIKKQKVTTTDGRYQCILPESAVDIKIEGRCQHHCVGGYTDRAARGETLIFYIRERKEQRLYTAEYKKGELIQVRARYNADPTPEAKKLAQQFAKELAVAEEKEAKKDKKQMAEAV